MNQRARLDPAPIPFIDVAAQRRRLGRSVDEAIARVLGHCQFILGPEVRALETALAAFCGARHAVSCASGTDALVLVLMAKGVGPGDAVICPSFTFTATAEVAVLVGATPVFADVEEGSFNLDPESLQRACATARKSRASSQGRDPGRSFRTTCGLRSHHADRRGGGPFRPRRCGPSLRCDLQEPPPRCSCTGNRDQLLSREAARMLWRWRGRAHRGRRARAGDAQPARPW